MQTEAKFKVGDVVTFTNDYGVVFPGKAIIGTEEWYPGETRYFYTPTDTPWFSVREESLRLEK